MSEEEKGEEEKGSGWGCVMFAAPAVCFFVACMVCLHRNPQWKYAGHEAQCVETDGSVEVELVYIHEDSIANPFRTATQKPGEPENPYGFSIISVEDYDPGRYTVVMQVRGKEQPDTSVVPACAAKTP